MKTISIVITNYNRVNFVDRAIRSCLDQSLGPVYVVEIIVVDDGSTDDSLKLLSMFKDDIVIIEHKRNLGVACASNSGLKAASGDFVMRRDADDFLNKYALLTLSSILEENEEFGFVYSDHFKVDEKGFKKEKQRLNNMEMLYNHGAGVMFRKEVVQSVGLYDESLLNCEDYDYLIRVAKNYKGYYLPLPLYRYSIHHDNLSLREDREKFKCIVRERHGL